MLFQRIINLFKSLIFKKVEDIEAQNPEAVYNAAIREYDNQLNTAEHDAARIVRVRKANEAKFKEIEGKLRDVNQALLGAAKRSDTALGATLMQQKNQLEADFASIKTELEKTSQEAEKVKNDILRLQAERDRTEDERDMKLGQLASAKTRIDMRQARKERSQNPALQALTNVRSSIDNTIAQADLGDELDASSLDSRIEAAKQAGAEANAEMQFAEYMRSVNAGQQAQQQDGGGPQKTM
jgi:phage shock protein A